MAARNLRDHRPYEEGLLDAYAPSVFNVTRVQLTAGAPVVCEADVVMNIGQELVTVTLPVPVTEALHEAITAVRESVQQSLESSVLAAVRDQEARTTGLDGHEAAGQTSG